MSWLNKIAAIIRPRQSERELTEELEHHIELKTQESIEAGMTPAEARYAALRAFGGIEQKKEECRDADRMRWLEDLVRDLQYGLRQLRRNPGFTAIAILTLALGIGANTAIFSYIDAWVIKPLPYPHSDRLMIFEPHNTKIGWTTEGLTSTASFLGFKRQNTSFDKIVMWTVWEYNLTGNGPPILMQGGKVSSNYFDALGAKPLLGRMFTPDEDKPGAGHVAILSEGLWRSRYGGNPKIIGQNIDLGDEAYTVIGVMPAKFQFPLMGVANLWTPLALTDQQRADRSSSFFSAFGLLKPGVTPKQAGAECSAIFTRLQKQFPATNANLTLLVTSMKRQIAREEGGPELMICLVIVGFILLIACANVANLMLARATNRAKEFALRSALGAPRGRLLRQLLAESVLLFFFGGAAGLAVSVAVVRWNYSQIPGYIRGYLVNFGRVDLDMTTFIFTAGIVLLCGIACGLAPAYEHSKHEVNPTLKESSGQASGGRHSARLRRAFVVTEITLAVIVLISTTLLVKSFIISVHSSPGFNPNDVVVAQLALPKTRYPEEWQQREFGQNVLARLRALPQIQSAGAASSVPFGGFGRWVGIEAADKPAPQPGERRTGVFTAVSDNYFSTMQIPLVKGRLFNSGDAQGGLPVAVIDRTMAQDLWPGEDPIGRKVRFGEQHIVCTVVGIVNYTKLYNLRSRPQWQMYVPLTQFPSTTFGFVVRTASSPSSVAAAIRDAIWSVDREQPISSVEQLTALISIANTGYISLARILVFFSALAMFLGMIGIYGLMSDQVSRRTHEIGIRVALGASPAQVLRMVVGQGLKLALIGVISGVIVAFGTSRLLASELYRVSPNDPLTFIIVPVFFTAIALLACYIPARRAMQVDPLVALRNE